MDKGKVIIHPGPRTTRSPSWTRNTCIKTMHYGEPVALRALLDAHALPVVGARRLPKLSERCREILMNGRSDDGPAGAASLS